MNALVRDQRHLVAEVITALITLVRTFACVQQLMGFKMKTRLKTFITFRAIEISYIFMKSVHVGCKSTRFWKTFIAQFATYLVADTVSAQMVA